jgi:hypothetical protein
VLLTSKTKREVQGKWKKLQSGDEKTEGKKGIQEGSRPVPLYSPRAARKETGV